MWTRHAERIECHSLKFTRCVQHCCAFTQMHRHGAYNTALHGIYHYSCADCDGHTDYHVHCTILHRTDINSNTVHCASGGWTLTNAAGVCTLYPSGMASV